MVQVARLNSFWRSSKEDMPQKSKQWCEVWLRDMGDETLTRFQSILKQLNINFKNEFLLFPERFVLLVKASRRDLLDLIASSEGIAELRRAVEITTNFYLSMSPSEQAEFTEDMVTRTEIDRSSNTVVCVLDTRCLRRAASKRYIPIGAPKITSAMGPTCAVSRPMATWRTR